MGIPKFFRWAAERYPQVITPFKENPPPIDNLYLDMNGIIHHCTHPNDIDATKKSATEKEMVAAMFGYIEKLFAAVQPRKYFLMAVDGCAPRAKMNQQRQRRYRSGYEMMVAREEALAMGEELPDEGDVFDSNCITPGTEFMFRISEHIQYFITMKLHQDEAWRNCTVIYSGHDNPGEGEHKIIDFVRRRKMQPDYSPNETHCMYGLDADLMMLAMATHEPHFVLLREVVSFGGGGTKRERERKMEDEQKGLVEAKGLAKAESFVLFHINLLREYLEIDMKRPDTPEFEIERVIDDFVFMCFFIGNDFLPSLPTVAISDNGMTTMTEIYREVCLKKGCYLTRDGQANWNSIEPFIQKLGELELDTLRARQEEELEYRKRQRSRNPENEVNFTPLVPITNMADYKQKFYSEKHKFEEGWNPRGDEMAALRQHYVEGLLWVMEYYYRGPPSWKWYYPHHYAPMASDLVNLSSYASKVRFDKGAPFLPHQQLLAVLPPMSARSLPAPYWPLLQSNNSPLRKYFPKHLEIDKEGARNPWEGTVLIPFIDEAELLSAYESVQDQLSEEDKAKNRNTNNLVFRHNSNVQPYNFPSAMFEPLQKVQVERKSYKFPDAPTFVPRLMKGVRLGENGGMEGFATFHSKRHLIEPVYETGVVSVFGNATKKESLLLKINSADGLTPSIARAAPPSADDFRFLMGQRVWIAFPFYKRARVTAMTDSRGTLQTVWDKNGNLASIERKEHNADSLMAFKRDVEAHQAALKAKCGLFLPEISILVHAHRHIDMRISRSGRLVPQYSKKETVYPLQTISPVDKVNLHEDARYVERDRSESDYQMGTSVLYIGAPPRGVKGTAEDANPCYGCTGYVMEKLEGEDDAFDITLNVFSDAMPLPPAAVTQYSGKGNWHSLHEVSQMLHVSSAALSQICSSVVTTAQFGSQELGLCLKFTGKELARVGYAKMVQTHFNPWYVSRPNIFGFMAEDEDDEVTGYHLQTDGKKPQQPRGKPQERGQFNRGAHVNAAGRGSWYFSDRAVALIREYCEAFRPLVTRMEEGGGNTSALEPQSFLTGDWAALDVSEVLKKIETWLEEKGIHNMPMAMASDDCLPDELVTALEEHKSALALPRATKQVRLRKVHRRSLYFPTVRLPEGFVTAVPLPVKDQRFTVGARVVHVRTSGTVPFGAMGTVIRLVGHGQMAEVLLDEPFVGGSTFSGRLKTNRGALVKLQAMLLLEQSKASGVSPELGPRPTPSPGSIPPEVDGLMMPSSAAGGAFNVGNWAKQFGLGSTPPPAGASGSKPVTIAKRGAGDFDVTSIQQKTASPASVNSGGINVAQKFGSATAAPAAAGTTMAIPQPKSKQSSLASAPAAPEGINVAEKLGALAGRNPSPPPTGEAVLTRTTSGSGGVNLAAFAQQVGISTPERRASPQTSPPPQQAFPAGSQGSSDEGGFDLRNLQKELAGAAQTQNQNQTVSPTVPKPRSAQTTQPVAPAAIHADPAPVAPTPAAVANVQPHGRLTEDKIGAMMSAMIKAQLENRYGKQ